MIKECPHCFSKVIPSANGLCPNCSNSVGKKPNSKIRLLPIKEGSIIPEICIKCGGVHDKFVKYSEKHEQGGENPFIRFFIMLYKPITFLKLKSELYGKQYSSDLYIPYCKKCLKEGGKLKLVNANYERSELFFKTSSLFADKYLKLNKKKN